MLCRFINVSQSNIPTASQLALGIPVVHGSEPSYYCADGGAILCQLWILEHYTLEYCCALLSKPVIFEIRKADAGELLLINLNGKSRLQEYQSGVLSLGPNEGVLLNHPNVQGFGTLLANQEVTRFLVISFSYKTIETVRLQEVNTRAFFGVSPRAVELIERILFTAYQTIQPFQQRQINELFSLAHQLVLAPKTKTNGSTQDIAAIYIIKELLDANIEKDHSIFALARKAAMHPRKLNQVFQQVFEKTIYCYIREKRLDAAHDKIENTHALLKVISRAAGYRSYSNFSVAFHTRFGYSPVSLRKK